MRHLNDFKDRFTKVLSGICGDSGRELLQNAVSGNLSVKDIPKDLSIGNVEQIRASGVLFFDNISHKDYVEINKALIDNADHETKKSFLLVLSLPEISKSLSNYELFIYKVSREIKREIRVNIAKVLGESASNIYSEAIDQELSVIFDKTMSLEKVNEISDDIYPTIHQIIKKLIKPSNKRVSLLEQAYHQDMMMISYGSKRKFPLWKKSVEYKDNHLTNIFTVRDVAPVKNYHDQSFLTDKKDEFPEFSELKLPWAPTVKRQVRDRFIFNIKHIEGDTEANIYNRISVAY